MVVVTHNGHHKPFQANEEYAIFGTRTPALHGFRLTHVGTDHQLVDIRVRPGGHSVDLSPAADLQLLPVPDGELDVGLQDADPAEDEFGYWVSHSILNIRGAGRFQLRDVGCVDACKRVVPAQVFGGGHLPPPDRYLLAITGFRLFFTGNRNHRLNRIGVWFDGRELNVALQDQGGGDTFGYMVDFVVIPRLGLSVVTGVERGTQAQSFETHNLLTPPSSHFMLTGWVLDFEHGDNEVLDIGVLGGDKGFTVFYSDSGGGDLFDWRVEWAQVGPEVLERG